MQILDVTCPYCGAVYQAAVSDSVTGAAGQFDCQLCAEVADRWEDAKLRVHRLMTVPTEAALHVSAKPLPLV